MAGNRVISAVLTLRDRNFGSTASRAANSTRDLERRVRSTGNSVRRFGRDATASFKNVAKSAVGMAAAYVGFNAIKDLGVSMVQNAASAEAMASQFEQVFSGMESAASSSLSKVANETGILSERLKGSFLGMAAFAKTTGMDTAGALALTERATLAAADGAAFYDKSIEEVSESLQSFLKGNFANDAALGISATETTRNATANKLYGSSFKKLSEEQKQLTLLQMVEDGNKLSGAIGQAARETDGLENVLGNLRSSWETLKAKFGVPILAPVVKGMKALTAVISNVDTEAVIKGFNKFGSIAKGVLKSLQPGLGWIKDNAIPGVKKAVELLGIGVLVLKDWAVDAFQNIKQRITENKPAIEAVQGVMSDLGAKALELKDWMLDAFESSKPALSWLKDEGLPLVVDGIAAVVEKATETYNYINDNWNAISPIVYGVAGAILFYKTAMGIASLATKGMALATVAMSVAQGAFNAVLAISPLGWVAIAIGAVVAAGVLLYQNWDTVKEKGQQLWDALKGVWTGIQTGFSAAWEIVKSAAADSINGVIGKINGLIGAINKIPGVNIPIVAQVDWGQATPPSALPKQKATTSATTGLPSRGTGIGGLGSYAVGTNRIDKDQIAKVHKDEMIIPARQSRNLRNQGVTIDNIDKPTARTNTSNGHSGGSFNFGDIIIQGANMTAEQIADQLIPAIKLRMSNI